MDNEYLRIIRFIAAVLTIYLVILGIVILFMIGTGNTIAGILAIVNAVIIGKFGFILMNHYEDVILRILTNQKKIANQRAKISTLKTQIADIKAARNSQCEMVDMKRITELQTRIAYLENNIRLAKQRIGTSLET